jgi:hypothetical protein
MPENDERKTFPMLAPSHWWKLRKKFHQSIPGVVTDSYVATVLEMEEVSARSNVMPYLKSLGLISQDGKPTELVKQWRDDESYSDACKAILTTYPEELLHAIDDISTGRPKAERWFRNKAGVGQNAAAKMASIFMVIYEGDVKKAPEGRSATAPKQAAKTVETVPKGHIESEGSGGRSQSAGPEVNINLQIHISADASPDQIDQIFVSMSKHLYKNAQ